MKTILKLAIPFALIAALVIAVIPGEQASATPPCPSNHCPADLFGYTKIGPCLNFNSGNECLGWIYKKGANTCHKSALTGI